MYSYDGVYLHSNVIWLVENNLDCEFLCSEMTETELYEFLILFKYIHYWLASNVCKSDTSGSRFKVPFVVTLIKETTIALPSRILTV